jgi:hypothetical protein
MSKDAWPDAERQGTLVLQTFSPQPRQAIFGEREFKHASLLPSVVRTCLREPRVLAKAA